MIQRQDEYQATIEIARADLYRQMDAKDFVFAQREASPARGVTP